MTDTVIKALAPELQGRTNLQSLAYASNNCTVLRHGKTKTRMRVIATSPSAVRSVDVVVFIYSFAAMGLEKWGETPSAVRYKTRITSALNTSYLKMTDNQN